MNFGDIPYGPIRDALNTIFGRLALLLATILVAWILGAWTATGSMSAGLRLLPDMPTHSFLSFIFGHGYFTWPLILIFGFAFVRGEWRWRWLLVPLLLAWWSYHGAVDYDVYRSPEARSGRRFMQKVEEDIPRKHAAKIRKAE